MAYRNYGYQPERAKPMPIPVIGMWRRFFASLVDSLLMGFISVVLVGLGIYLAFEKNPNASLERLIAEFDATTWVLNGAAFIIGVIYYVGCWSMGGQTVGKWLAGIKVVGDDGNAPSLAAAGLRYLGYIINNILFSIGFLAIAFDKRKQGWHDKMGNTFVVPSNIELPPGVEPLFVYPNESNTADILAVAAYFFAACILPCILVFGVAALAPDILRQIDPSLAP